MTGAAGMRSRPPSCSAGGKIRQNFYNRGSLERFRSRLFLLRWLLFIVWGVLVLWLSLMSDPPAIDDDLLGWDKFEHGAAYSLLTILAGWAFCNFRLSAKLRWSMAASVAVGIGALLEVLQGSFTRTRTAEWGDLLADAIGAGIILLLAIVLEKKFGAANRG